MDTLASRAPISAVLGLIASGLAAVTAPSYGEDFTDVAASAGLAFHHESGFLVPIGAGAAWADFDGDGDEDLFAVQGTGCNKLFVNDGAGGFVEVSDAAGAAGCTDVSHGAGVADLDNDGDQDLFVTNYGQNHLYVNLLVEGGGLAFADVTVAAGMDDDGAYNSSSAVWGDYDNDGHLDLFVGNHAEFPLAEPLVCHADQVWHNDGDGSFTDVADATGIGLSGVLDKVGCALAATWSDYDDDGDADLMVINDFGPANEVPNRLFRNDGAGGEGGWLFTDVSSESGFDYVQAGMGIAIGDLDRDGLLDYYMSDAGDNDLALANGDGTFTNIAASAGVLAGEIEIWGGWAGLISWGTGFYDLDGDGWEELVVANGGAPNDKWPGMFGVDYIDHNPVYTYRNLHDATFAEAHAALGIAAEDYFRTAVFSDYDDDGDIDIYLGNLQGMNRLYRNDTANTNTWLKVKVAGTLGNRDAIGARIVAYTPDGVMTREVSGGSGFLSRNTLTAHFGLGRARSVGRLSVRFPSGVSQELAYVPVNQTLTVTEPVVTATFESGRFLVAAGETLPLAVELNNRTESPQPLDIWIDDIAAAGATRTLIGPFDRPLAAGETATASINLPTGPTLPPGVYLLAVRLGEHPDTVVHQDFTYVGVTASGR